MPVTTSKTNAGVHPSHIILNNWQTKHTRKQLEDDDSRARAVDHTNQEKAKAKYCTVVEHIAELEDTVALAKKDNQTHAQWPDLHVGPSRLSKFSKCTSGSHKPLELSEDNDDSAASVDVKDRPALEGDKPQTITEGTQVTMATLLLRTSLTTIHISTNPACHLVKKCVSPHSFIFAHLGHRNWLVPLQNTKKGTFRAEVTAAHKHTSGISNKCKTPVTDAHIFPYFSVFYTDLFSEV